MGEYREPDRVRSEALERLAARAARAEHELPRDAGKLAPHVLTARLEAAAGVGQDRPGCLIMLALLGGAFSAFVLVKVLGGQRLPSSMGLVVFGSTAVLAGWSVWATRTSARRRATAVEALLAWERDVPFPISGYRDWLVADAPALQVTLRAPIDPDQLRRALPAVDAAATLDVLDEQRFRISFAASRPGASGDQDGEPDRHAQVTVLRRFHTELLLPLHHDVGIEQLAMGGAARPDDDDDDDDAPPSPP